MANNNNADLSVACVKNYLHYEGFVSNRYRAKFNVGGSLQDWDIEQYILPLPYEKADNLYKAGLASESEGVKEYSEAISEQLSKEALFQKSLAGEDMRCAYEVCVRYLYFSKTSQDGNVVYYLLSEPHEPISVSSYMNRDNISFLQLLDLSRELLHISDVLNAFEIKSYSFSENNLVVNSEGRLKLKALYCEDSIGKSRFGLASAAAFIWHLASGKLSEIDEGRNLPDAYPSAFTTLLRNLVAPTNTKTAVQALRTIDKLLSDVNAGVMPDFTVSFPKKEVSRKPESTEGRYPRFNFKKYIEEKRMVSELDIITDSNSDILMQKFEALCLQVKKKLDELDANEIKEEATLNRQRRALLGYPKEVSYYKAKINEIVIKNGQTKAWKPAWYKSVAEAIYGEILGFSGISNWLSDEKYKDSISCKIIGERIYYKGASGYLELQPQRIDKDRRDLLKRTLLLINPKEPLSRPWHEIYTVNEHLRVTIYNDNGISKGGEDAIILRRYVLKNLSLAEFVRRKTFPAEAQPLIENMVKLGFNVCFSGPVESGKSTFLQAYQQLEDPKLEAVSIESDDETQYHKLMPKAPILQFVPDKDQEETVLERVKRSDANYIVIGEARSGKYLGMAVDAANMGTRRMKMTFHNTETIDFAYDVAEKITKDVGGDIVANMIKVSKSFDYIFVLTPMPGNRAVKKLKGIWEMEFDADNTEIIMTQICKYVPSDGVSSEKWVWTNHIGESKKEAALWENPDAYKAFALALENLSNMSPNTDKVSFKNPYMDVFLRGGRSVI